MIDWNANRSLRAALRSAEESPQQFQENLVAALHASLSPDMIHAIWSRQQAGKTIIEKGRGSPLFRHLFRGTPLPYIYGVTFDEWDDVWVNRNKARSYMSARRVASQVLELLDKLGEWAEPDVAFPHIDKHTGTSGPTDLEQERSNVMEKIKEGKLIALREAGKEVDRVIRSERQQNKASSSSSASQSTGSASNDATKPRHHRGVTVDEAWQAEHVDFSSIEWGDGPRIIPLAILPFMMLAMCQTRDATFRMYNNPVGILFHARLYLHGIRTLFIDANHDCYHFTREDVPLTVHSAMMADEQCVAAWHLLSQYYGPLELTNVRAVREIERLTSALNEAALRVRVAQEQCEAALKQSNTSKLEQELREMKDRLEKAERQLNSTPPAPKKKYFS